MGGDGGEVESSGDEKDDGASDTTTIQAEGAMMLTKLSGKSALALAIQYALARWPGLVLCAGTPRP